MESLERVPIARSSDAVLPSFIIVCPSFPSPTDEDLLFSSTCCFVP